jgi:hypothetical protein
MRGIRKEGRKEVPKDALERFVCQTILRRMESSASYPHEYPLLAAFFILLKPAEKLRRMKQPKRWLTSIWAVAR